jgi:hypothetical protein
MTDRYRDVKHRYRDVKQRATSGASVGVVFTDPTAALG